MERNSMLKLRTLDSCRDYLEQDVKAPILCSIATVGFKALWREDCNFLKKMPE